LVKQKSYELFRAIAEELYGKTLLISVGGIDSAEEAYKRIKAGASLVQVYSMLVYKGPSLVRDINRGLIDLLEADGYTHISEAIGADWKH
jgi:dihydroorotate dehydrogenase